MTCVEFLWLTYLTLFINLLKFATANGLIYENGNRENDEIYWIDSSVPTGCATANISENCMQHTQEYLEALRSRQSWAVKSKLEGEASSFNRSITKFIVWC